MPFCDFEEKKAYQKVWWTSHPSYDRERIAKTKVKVLTHYCGGKPHCVCNGEDCCHSGPCEITDIRVLTIDHINDGGTKQRKELNASGSLFYRWLVKNNYPEGFQVLCYNCNIVKFARDRQNVRRHREPTK